MGHDRPVVSLAQYFIIPPPCGATCDKQLANGEPIAVSRVRHTETTSSYCVTT